MKMESRWQILYCFFVGVLGQAAMNVKPMLLTVIETHLLKLGPMLRPAMTGMVVGLLPGLEEGAETFDRVNNLLEQISHGVGLSYFYSAIWEAMLLSTSVRLQGMSAFFQKWENSGMMESISQKVIDFYMWF
jgi:hypothetical protein